MGTLETKKAKKNYGMFVASVVVLLCTLLMVSAIFMPYSTAANNMATTIKNNPNSVVYAELNMTAKDLSNISMVQYARIYTTYSKDFFGNRFQGIYYVVFVTLIGGFSLLTAVFCLLKKPLAVIIFDVLAFGVFCLQNWDFTNRGISPTRSYEWGSGYYIFFAAVFVVLIAATWQLVSKSETPKKA